MTNAVEEFLSNFPETIRKIINELRKMAKDAMPKAHEFLYYDAVNYSVNDSPTGRICYLSPSQDHVMVGFLFGVHLDDKHHLLQGFGKQARHIKIKTMNDAKNRDLKDLVRAAWSHGPELAPKQSG